MSRIARALIIAVVAVALVVTAAAIVPRIAKHRATSELRAETRSAYEAAVPGWERSRAGDDAVLAEVLGAPAQRTRVVRCWLDESYSGWIVSGWAQVCQVRAVEIYPTKLTRQTASARLTAAAGTSSAPAWLRTPPTDQPAHPCAVLRADRPTLQQAAAVTFLPAGRPPTGDLNDPCAVPVGDDPDWSGLRQVEGSIDPTAIGADRSWVAVTHELEFQRLDLACHGLLGCDPPVDQPVLP